MNSQRLIAMANDIAAFFAAEPDAESGAEQVANHMRKFWDPRMRDAIQRIAAAGGTGMSALALSGVRRL
jgi:formate dehydrogenase subunit delta